MYVFRPIIHSTNNNRDRRPNVQPRLGLGFDSRGTTRWKSRWPSDRDATPELIWWMVAMEEAFRRVITVVGPGPRAVLYFLRR